MALASRHRLRLVVYGSAEPPTPNGREPDLSFRVRIDGSTPQELVNGFCGVLDLLGFSASEVFAGLEAIRADRETVAFHEVPDTEPPLGPAAVTTTAPTPRRRRP